MTDIITTAAELLTAGDSNFIGLLSVWELAGQCPLPLVDVLLEYDLESQAEAARWCATQPKRRSYYDGPDDLRFVNPYRFSRTCMEFVLENRKPDEVWCYDEVPYSQVGYSDKALNATTFADCVCKLFDIWRTNANSD